MGVIRILHLLLRGEISQGQRGEDRRENSFYRVSGTLPPPPTSSTHPTHPYPPAPSSWGDLLPSTSLRCTPAATEEASSTGSRKMTRKGHARTRTLKSTKCATLNTTSPSPPPEPVLPPASYADDTLAQAHQAKHDFSACRHNLY